MILIDAIITLLVFLVTVLGSSAFLSIAFVEGASTSRAGGAIVARRAFAISMCSSVFLFAIPILFLLGVYSEDFARAALSATLSVAVAWNAIVLPMLVLRLALARVLQGCCSTFSSSSMSRRGTSGGKKCCSSVGLVAWSMSLVIVLGVWTTLLFAFSSTSLSLSSIMLSSSSTNTNTNTNTTTTRVVRKSYACRFTANDVSVLRRGGMLGSRPDSLGSASDSQSMSHPQPKVEQQSQKKQEGNTVGGDSTNGDDDNSNSDDNKNKQTQDTSPGEQAGKENEDDTTIDDDKLPRHQKKGQEDDDSATGGGGAGNQQQQALPSLPPLRQVDLDSILAQLQESACSGLRDSVLARIALAGACCVAALSGFAAVATPIENLFPYLNRNSVRDAQNSLTKLQRRLQQVLRRWGNVSREGARLAHQLNVEIRNMRESSHFSSSVSSSNAATAGTGGGGWLMSHFGSLFSNSTSNTNKSSHHHDGQSQSSTSLTNVRQNNHNNSNHPNRAEALQRQKAIYKRMDELQVEIAGYKYLTASLFLAIDQASATLDVASMGRTRTGKLRAAMGILLSLFAAAKAVNLLISVTFRKLSGEDAATTALRMFVNFFSLQGTINVTEMASRVSLVLNMFLVMNSVRGFLILMFRLTQSKATSKTTPPAANGVADDDDDDDAGSMMDEQQVAHNNGDDENGRLIDSSGSGGGGESSSSSSWKLALLFGGPSVDQCPGTLSLVSFSLFMGLHFLGAFVLLRLGFPVKSRAIIIDAVGTVPFVPYHSTHDVSFLVAVVVTCIVLRLLGSSAAFEEDDDDDFIGV